MKIIAKFLTGKEETIEVDSSTTIEQLKESILASQGWEGARIRVIHSGKALADDKTIGDYDIKEDNAILFVVQLLN